MHFFCMDVSVVFFTGPPGHSKKGFFTGLSGLFSRTFRGTQKGVFHKAFGHPQNVQTVLQKYQLILMTNYKFVVINYCMVSSLIN